MQSFYKTIFYTLLPVILLCACTKDSDSNDAPDNCDVIGLNPRIINGTACELNFSPVVSVSIQNSRSVGLCSGVMLTQSAVLTAGHCLAGNIESIEVTGGPSGALSQSSPAASYSIHPRIGIGVDNTFVNDAGIVFLEQSLSLPTIPIIASQSVQVDDTLSIFGFGKNEDGDFGVLTSGEVKVDAITSSTFITRFNDGFSNTCQGDSGGPALLTVGRSNGGARTGVVGIASNGENRSCSPGDRAAFTNVQNASVLDYIRSEVSSVRIE